MYKKGLKNVGGEKKKENGQCANFASWNLASDRVSDYGYNKHQRTSSERNKFWGEIEYSELLIKDSSESLPHGSRHESGTRKG